MYLPRAQRVNDNHSTIATTTEQTTTQLSTAPGVDVTASIEPTTTWQRLWINESVDQSVNFIYQLQHKIAQQTERSENTVSSAERMECQIKLAASFIPTGLIKHKKLRKSTNLVACKSATVQMKHIQYRR